MVSYQYSYLLMDLIFLIIWISLFIWRKDTRKEMLIMSFIFGIVGLLVKSTYILDWWRPLTITNTSIGIENFLFGFVIGGIATIIYTHIFNKKVKTKKLSKIKAYKRNIDYIILSLIFAILFFGSFYILKLNTLYSSIIAFVLGISIIYLKREDLIKNSLLSGVLLLIISFIVYTITELITPGWIQAFWHFKNIPNIVILNVPLDDVIWYFLAGAFIGPLYEYWQEGKLINKK